MDHTLKHIQTELAEEQQRLAHLREAFQVQYCADELDAAGLLATAHLAQSRAARSAQRIRGLQSLLDFLRHGGRPLCEDCGEEIPMVRLLPPPAPRAAANASRCWRREKAVRQRSLRLKTAPCTASPGIADTPPGLFYFHSRESCMTGNAAALPEKWPCLLPDRENHPCKKFLFPSVGQGRIQGSRVQHAVQT